ncbi:MAG: XRE family transcriptional regulator [Alphaproteobacteria bacterium]|nr:MAG: XRE family transcriptional regulator [Alphaproteobacteria bacterium]
MAHPVQVLLEQLVAAAKARGMTQAELAQKAGISPVGLSKARHRGDLKVSTLIRLAQALDMDLKLAPARRREKAAEAIRTGRFFDLKGSR